MSTDIAVDDTLLREVIQVTGIASEQQAVELVLQELLRRAKQREGLKYIGKIPWDGDLDAMRSGDEK